jgi:hypothetical protein
MSRNTLSLGVQLGYPREPDSAGWGLGVGLTSLRKTSQVSKSEEKKAKARCWDAASKNKKKKKMTKVNFTV